MMTAPARPTPDRTQTFGNDAASLRTIESQMLGDVSSYSFFWRRNSEFWQAANRIALLEKLASNWDSYGAPSPNDLAVRNAHEILRLAFQMDLDVTSIVPSAEGGIGFCFRAKDKYADIESTNEGEIIGVRYQGMEAPILIEAENNTASLQAALSEIKEHIE